MYTTINMINGNIPISWIEEFNCSYKKNVIHTIDSRKNHLWNLFIHLSKMLII